jgi:hypothetical protein
LNWLNQIQRSSVATANSLGGVGVDQQMVGMTDIATKLGEFNKLLGQLIQTLQDLSPTSTDVFTMDAATSKVITAGAVSTASYITLWPTNAAAGTLVGAGLYWTAGTGSFTVSTSGGAALGTETFAYAIWTSL